MSSSSNVASSGGRPAADEEADPNRPNRLRQDQPRDIPRGRTERHPHADFPAALFDEVGQHAEQARRASAPAPARRGRPSTRTRPAGSRSPSSTGSRMVDHLTRHVGIDRGQSIQERLPGQFGIAVHARDQRRAGRRRHAPANRRPPYSMGRCGIRRRLGRPRRRCTCVIRAGALLRVASRRAGVGSRRTA